MQRTERGVGRRARGVQHLHFVRVLKRQCRASVVEFLGVFLKMNFFLNI